MTKKGRIFFFILFLLLAVIPRGATYADGTIVKINSGNPLKFQSNESRDGILISIDDIPTLGLGAFQFDITWNPDIIHINTVVPVTLNGFLFDAGIPDNTTGIVTIVGFSTGTSYPTGDIVLATLSAVATGSPGKNGSLNANIVVLSDQNGTTISATTFPIAVDILNNTSPTNTNIKTTVTTTSPNDINTPIIIPTVTITRTEDTNIPITPTVTIAGSEDTSPLGTGTNQVTVSDLSIDPDRVGTGKDVNVNAKITNHGSKATDYEATLKVNGIIEDTQTLSLSPGEEKTISFNLQINSEGNYTIDVGGQETQIHVSTEITSPTTSQTNANSRPLDRFLVWIVLGIALLVISLLVIIQLSRKVY
jgi:hypothetical protein